MDSRLGPYEILRPLGSGGMGEVYEARDLRLARTVAIKVLRASTLQRDDASARLKREAHVIAQLNHPNICALYDVGEDGGTYYLVMQLLQGETLASRLQRGRLPLDEALKYAQQIADAIGAAHSQGVTHRDLKPSNIMLTKSGAMLLDFGLAKLNGSDRVVEQMGETTSVGLTREGAIVGTVRYMAPEILDRKPADARSDLFSFGAVLYEMVTGRRPFEGDSEARIIAAIMAEEPPPLTALRPDAPSALETVVRKCLAKDPSERWQTALDLVDVLRLIGSESLLPTPARLANPGRTSDRAVRRTWRLAAGVVALAIAVATGAAMFWGGRSAMRPLPPPHLVALPCEGEPAATRALCDGMTESLIGKLVQLTQTHAIQVTPQLGGLDGTVLTIDDARRVLGASRVLRARAESKPNGDAITFSMADARTGTEIGAQSVAIDPAGIFDAEERGVAWLVRIMALELTHVDRENLVARATASGTARIAYLTGRGHLSRIQTDQQADDAVAAFSAALEQDSRYPLAHASLGMAWRAKYLRARDAESGRRARVACGEAVKLQPSFSEGRTCLGMLLYADRRYEEAAAELARAVEADPTNDDATVWLARTQEELRLPADAERTYLRAIERRPNYVAPRAWLAIFYRRQARYDEAAVALARAVALVPDHARLRAALGVPLMYLGRYEEALAAFRESVALDPTREAFVSWGVTLFRMRRFEEAVAVIERGRGSRPPDVTLLGSLARAYYWWGTPDARAKAETLYREAIQLAERDLAQPSGRLPSADMHIAAADYYAKLGRGDAAHMHLREVGLNIDDDARPRDPHQLFFAALVYAQLAERETALKWLERAVYWGVPAAELRAWPELDSLRNERAFQQLLKPTT